MGEPREVLEFADLDPYLLLKNGNFLYRIPYRDGFAVLKVYYGSHGPVARLLKSVQNVLISGQTSYQPRTRLRVERDCIDVWRQHGFRVFDVYDDVEIRAPQAPAGGYLLFEYVARPKLRASMTDASVPEDDRFAIYRRFLIEWSRRHEMAIAEHEPRLVHENGEANHVMILEDGTFLWFDFEMTWTSTRGVRHHVSHEIIQYLWDLGKALGPDLRDRLLRETALHYPVRERLAEAHDYLFRHPNPLHRLGRALDRTLRSRAKKPTSKYSIGRHLFEALRQV